MFENATPNTDRQLLAREGQWIFTIEGKKYYLPLSKWHFLLSFFKSVMGSWKMRWSVTQFTDSVHVRILTLNGYNCCGSPRAVLGMHPRRIGQDSLLEKTRQWPRHSLTNSSRFKATTQRGILGLPVGYILLRSHSGGI